LSTASLAADGITFTSSENLSLILDLVLDKEAAAAETLLSFTSNYPDNKPYKVKRILKHKVVSQGKEKVYMYKVRWASYEKKYYEWISPDRSTAQRWLKSTTRSTLDESGECNQKLLASNSQ